MAKTKKNPFAKYEAPSRDVMSAGVKTPWGSPDKIEDTLERTHAVLCAFIGTLANRMHEIMEGEDCPLKDVLWLILQMKADRGYYPTSKLIKGGKSTLSYLLRIGDEILNGEIRKLYIQNEKTELKRLKKKLDDHKRGKKLIRSKKNEDLDKVVQSIEERIRFLERRIPDYEDPNCNYKPGPEKRKDSGHRLDCLKLEIQIQRSETKLQTLKGAKLAKETEKLVNLRTRLSELARKIKYYDSFNSNPPFNEFKIWFNPKINGGFGLSSDLGELIITEALQYVSHHLELQVKNKEKRENQEAELEAFKESKDGKALLEACKDLEHGPATWIEKSLFPEFADWRGNCPNPLYPTVDLDNDAWTAEFRKLNPEFDAFLLTKKKYCDLSKFDDPPTWRPICWNKGKTKEERKGRRYPFFGLKYFCSGMGLVPFQGKNRIEASLQLRLLDVSDKAYELALKGIPDGGFTERKKDDEIRIELVPDIRLQNAMKKTGFDIPVTRFEISDPKSKETFFKDFTGLRFREENEKWQAKLTFKPTLGIAFDFEEVLKVYRQGKSATFLPGTLLSAFVFTATEKYIPKNDAAGWFATFGVNEDGSLTELYSTAVTPYLPSDHYRVVKKYRYDVNDQSDDLGPKNALARINNAKTGELIPIWLQHKTNDNRTARYIRYYFHKTENKIVTRRQLNNRIKSVIHISRGHAKLSTIEQIMAIVMRMAKNLKLSGRKPKQPNKGDNNKLRRKLNYCVESFREQLSAQIIRLALRVEGRLEPQGYQSQKDVKQPTRIKEWTEQYPGAKHLLCVPAPMGSSHQSYRRRGENKLLHTIGLAQIYTLILTKSCYSRISTTLVTKIGMWTTNIFTGEKCVSSNKGQEVMFDADGKKHLVPRGRVGTTNLIKRLFNPLPKKLKEEEPNC